MSNVFSGPPDVPNCSIQYFESEKRSDERQIEIACKPGKDNGLAQTLHLNLYRVMAGGLTINDSTTLSDLNEETSNRTINRITHKTNNMSRSTKITTYELNNELLFSTHLLAKHPTKIQHNHFIGQYNHTATCLQHDLISNQNIAINFTSARFRRITLSTANSLYLLIIYASNARGRSGQIEWMLDTGAATNNQLTSSSALNYLQMIAITGAATNNQLTSSSALNYLQMIAITGYFFVGIFCAIVCTYLLLTLALWFLICLRLQFFIFNHRLLTKSRNKQSIYQTNQSTIFTVSALSNNNLSNESTFVPTNNLYSHLNQTSNDSIIPAHSANSLSYNSPRIRSNNCKTNVNSDNRNLNKNHLGIYRTNCTFDKMFNSLNSINNLTHSLSHLSTQPQYDEFNLCTQAIETDLINENIYINSANFVKNNKLSDCEQSNGNGFQTKIQSD